jgi:hypothetical protein
MGARVALLLIFAAFEVTFSNHFDKEWNMRRINPGLRFLVLFDYVFLVGKEIWYISMAILQNYLWERKLRTQGGGGKDTNYLGKQNLLVH